MPVCTEREKRDLLDLAGAIHEELTMLLARTAALRTDISVIEVVESTLQPEPVAVVKSEASKATSSPYTGWFAPAPVVVASEACAAPVRLPLVKRVQVSVKGQAGIPRHTTKRTARTLVGQGKTK